MDYQSLSSSSRSVPSSCTRWQRTCRGNTKTTGSVTALNRIFYSIARITSITHLTTSYDQLKSQGRNSPTSVILSRVPSTILAIFFFFFQPSLCKQVSLSHRPYHGSRFILNSSSEKLIIYISFISKRSFAALMKFRWKIEDP